MDSSHRTESILDTNKNSLLGLADRILAQLSSERNHPAPSGNKYRYPQISIGQKSGTLMKKSGGLSPYLFNIVLEVLARAF